VYVTHSAFLTSGFLLPDFPFLRECIRAISNQNLLYYDNLCSFPVPIPPCVFFPRLFAEVGAPVKGLSEPA
jgi:hypothetical protein